MFYNVHFALQRSVVIVTVDSNSEWEDQIIDEAVALAVEDGIDVSRASVEVEEIG